MSTLRQVAQQALEALERYEYAEARTALRAALAEPEQEPVAWWNGRETVWFEHELMGTNPPIENPIPLYTAPTPRNEPVIDKTMAKRIATQLGWEPPKKPLTEQEIQIIWAKTFEMGSSANTFARAIEKAHGIGNNT